jgi:hypothetical protein
MGHTAINAGVGSTAGRENKVLVMELYFGGANPIKLIQIYGHPGDPAQLAH